MAGWTDIDAGGWVARLPGTWRPYALLARLDRIIGAWLLFLPGLWGILLARGPDREAVRLGALFAVGSVVMRGAGCVVNDMWDRRVDRLVTRTAGRPLASGALRMRHAAAFLAVLLAIGLTILMQLNARAQLLGVLSLVLVALYPLAKRVTWWPQAMLGLTFGWGAPMGAVAASGFLGWRGGLLYAAAFFWILGYDTVYAHQDREDDALVGIRSTARLWGEHTGPFLLGCYGMTSLLLCAAGFAGGYPAWFPAALLPAVATLAWQVRALDIHDPALCLRLFQLNKWTGLLAATAFALAHPLLAP